MKKMPKRNQEQLRTIRVNRGIVHVDASTPRYPNSEMLIDLSDWFVLRRKNIGKIYAHQSSGKGSLYAMCGKSTQVHRVLMPNAAYVDHIDGNGLNNRRCNLREVTNRQNTQNRHTPSSSKYPGVHWCNKAQRWVAKIRIGSWRKHLGNFVSETDAARAYQNELKKRGEIYIGEVVK